MNKRIVIYEQDQSGEFEAHLEVWNDDRYVSVLTERSDKFIYAAQNAKMEGVLRKIWTETHEEPLARKLQKESVISPAEALKPLCKIEGCASRVKARAMCTKHYQRFLAHGDPLVEIKRGGYRGSK